MTALRPGAQIGSYEIISSIGAGGMGEVYRARDTKLKRDVAIKVLPVAFSRDPDRMARFRREAELLASLNHPNIAQIHGFEDTGSIQCLALEFVDGETLQERIRRGPIPVAEALSLALQIATALEAAHDRAIIHRDLKPANIKITNTQRVKVLDFGLAKNVGVEEPSALSHATTMANPSIEGVILGTATYMSPEQARAQETDTRSDVWAFGAVLYEMLAGVPAFPGDTLIEILGAVLNAEPDWSRLPSGLSPSVVTLLRRCLQKDRNRRLRDIGDARIEIDDALREPTHVVAVHSPKRRRRGAAAVTTAALIGAAGAALLMLALNRQTPVKAKTVSILLPAAHPLTFARFPGLALAISPSENELVYVGVPPRQLYLRSLQDRDRTVREIAGTLKAEQPFFSPDGKWIAFFTTDGELKKVSISGGNAVLLLDNIQGYGNFGTWVDEATIVITVPLKGLLRVPSEGGSPVSLTSVNPAEAERTHATPQFLPGTRNILFGVTYESDRADRIEAVTLDTGKRQLVLDNATQPRYVNTGHLLFRRDEVLLIAPFDPKKLQVTGPAIPVVEDIRREDVVHQLMVSPAGTLAYVPEVNPLKSLGSVVRGEAFQSFAGLSGKRLQHARVSPPNGQYIAFEMLEGLDSKVDVYDVNRGATAIRLTQEGSETVLAWHPNGKEVAVFSKRQSPAIFLKNLNGSERQLVAAEPGTTPRYGSWHHEGKLLAYGVQKGTANDIWIFSEDTKTTRAFRNGPAAEYSPMFSPDGKWLAYVSNKSRREEVYVASYPDGDDIPISAGGGRGPAWNPNGKELFYEAGGKLWSVSVTPERRGLRLGEPVKVLDMRVPGTEGAMERYSNGNQVGNGYDIFPDGRRVLIARGPDPLPLEIVLVLNWFQELR